VFEFHADMEPIKLRFHRPGRTPLNEIAKTIITVRNDTHDGISSHALLEKEAVEEIISPSRLGRYKNETRPKPSIALDSPCCYLELPCDQVLAVLDVRIVDANYQGSSGLDRPDTLSVCNGRIPSADHFPSHQWTEECRHVNTAWFCAY